MITKRDSNNKGSWYNTNRKALLKHSPSLTNILPQKPESIRLKLIPAKSGDLTAIIDGTLLHSFYNPKREAKKIIQSLHITKNTIFLAYGFGLGYISEELIVQFPNTIQLIIEPDIKIFQAATQSRDFSLLLKPSVYFLIGKSYSEIEKEITKLLDNQTQTQINRIKSKTLYERHESYFLQVDHLLNKRLSQQEINQNTIQRFGKRWVRNLLSNAKMVFSSPGVLIAKEKFLNIPAIVLAAGPSLSNILPLLPTLRNKCIIIAVDTALKPCLLSGISPDFLVVVDPQFWNSRHLDWCKPKNTILVSETSTSTRVFNLFNMPTLLISSLFPLGKYFESLVGEKGQLGAGGSVATTAWDLARFLGCKPIIMAGLDLGFPQNQTHCPETFFETLKLIESNRFYPASSATFKYQYSANPFWVKANNGDRTITDQRMQIYNWWFESQFNHYPDTESITVSEHATLVKGLQYKPIEQIYLKDNRRKINLIKDNLIKLISDTTNTKINSRKILKNILEAFLKLKNLSTEAIHICEKLSNNLESRSISQDAIEKLDKLDKQIFQSGAKVAASFLIQPIINQVQVETNSDPKSVVERSMKIYKGLYHSAKFHAIELEKVLHN